MEQIVIIISNLLTRKMNMDWEKQKLIDLFFELVIIVHNLLLDDDENDNNNNNQENLQKGGGGGVFLLYFSIFLSAMIMVGSISIPFPLTYYQSKSLSLLDKPLSLLETVVQPLLEIRKRNSDVITLPHEIVELKEAYETMVKAMMNPSSVSPLLDSMRTFVKKLRELAKNSVITDKNDMYGFVKQFMKDKRMSCLFLDNAMKTMTKAVKINQLFCVCGKIKNRMVIINNREANRETYIQLCKNICTVGLLTIYFFPSLSNERRITQETLLGLVDAIEENEMWTNYQRISKIVTTTLLNELKCPEFLQSYDFVGGKKTKLKRLTGKKRTKKIQCKKKRRQTIRHQKIRHQTIRCKTIRCQTMQKRKHCRTCGKKTILI